MAAPPIPICLRQNISFICVAVVFIRASCLHKGQILGSIWQSLWDYKWITRTVTGHFSLWFPWCLFQCYGSWSSGRQARNWQLLTVRQFSCHSSVMTSCNMIRFVMCLNTRGMWDVWGDYSTMKPNQPASNLLKIFFFPALTTFINCPFLAW